MKTLAGWFSEPWSLREWADLCSIGRAASAIIEALTADEIELSALGVDAWLAQQRLLRRQHWLIHVSDARVAEGLQGGLKTDPPHPFAEWLEASPLRHSASLATLVQEHFIFVRR